MKKKEKMPTLILPYIIRLFIYHIKDVSKVSTGLLNTEYDSVIWHIKDDGGFLKDNTFGNGKNIYPIFYPFFWIWIQMCGLAISLAFILYKAILLIVFLFQLLFTLLFTFMSTIGSISILLGRLLFIRKNIPTKI